LKLEARMGKSSVEGWLGARRWEKNLKLEIGKAEMVSAKRKDGREAET
jgi:hypothetical protein